MLAGDTSTSIASASPAITCVTATDRSLANRQTSRRMCGRPRKKVESASSSRLWPGSQRTNRYGPSPTGIAPERRAPPLRQRQLLEDVGRKDPEIVDGVEEHLRVALPEPEDRRGAVRRRDRRDALEVDAVGRVERRVVVGGERERDVARRHRTPVLPPRQRIDVERQSQGVLPRPPIGELRHEARVTHRVHPGSDVRQLEEDLVVDVAIQNVVGGRGQQRNRLSERREDDGAAVLAAARGAAAARARGGEDQRERREEAAHGCPLPAGGGHSVYQVCGDRATMPRLISRRQADLALRRLPCKSGEHARRIIPRDPPRVACNRRLPWHLHRPHPGRGPRWGRHPGGVVPAGRGPEADLRRLHLGRRLLLGHERFR